MARAAKMKMIGMIGGMSWESSAKYYRLLNEGVRDRLGPTASAEIVLWSFDFSEIARLQHEGDWIGLTNRMIDAAQRIERAGAKLLVICTDTMHRVAEAVDSAVAVPLLHIAGPTAERLSASSIRRVGLLRTAFTTEQEFFRERLRTRHGLNVIVPAADDRELVHRIISWLSILLPFRRRLSSNGFSAGADVRSHPRRTSGGLSRSRLCTAP
jgi:aspartate racemase